MVAHAVVWSVFVDISVLIRRLSDEVGGKQVGLSKVCDEGEQGSG